MVSITTFLEDEDNVKKLAKYLYHNVPVRDAVQLSKRVDYFRGKKLILTLQDEKFKKKFNFEGSPEDTGNKIGESLLKHQYIHASSVKDRKRRELVPLRTGKFESDGYYTWIYEASSVKKNLLLGSLILGFLGLVMFPIWPDTLKTGTWYISVTILVFFFIIINVRLVLFILLWVVGYEFWLFPNLFDDDAGIIESFLPFYMISKVEFDSETNMVRIVVLSGLALSGWYLYNQPTELDEILVIQRQFVSDLYEGKLLSSEEESFENNFVERTTPDLETLRKELEEEEEVEDDEADDIIDAFIEDDEKKEL